MLARPCGQGPSGWEVLIEGLGQAIPVHNVSRLSFRAILQLRRPRGTDLGSPPLPAAEPHTAALTDANLEDPSHPGVRRAMAGLYRMFGSPPSRRRARGHSNRDEGSPSRRLSGPGSSTSPRARSCGTRC